MRAKLVNNIPTFDELVSMAPPEIQTYIAKAKDIKQTQIWHPEGDVAIHIRIVYNRARRTGNMNLALGAFFHDLGKVDTTSKHPSIPDKYSARMHEHVSARLVDKYKNWIEELGGDYDIVHYLVSQHMRVKQIGDMRRQKQDAMRAHKWYSLIQQFTEFDNMRTDYSQDIED